MKIAIMTDTNSGISKSEAQKFGIHILPMPFNIDEKEYFEDVNLSKTEFYEKQIAGSNIFTSQPSPASICDMWDALLKSYDYIIHIPMSSNLSSSTDTAMALANDEEYEGKVYVIDNQRISITQRAAAIEASKMVELGKKPEEIKEYLLSTKEDSTIYLTVATLKYLKKGGRITPAAAALGTLLRIKPVLTIQKGGKIDSYAKARTMKQAKTLMIEALKKDLEEKFLDSTGNLSNIYVAHANDEAEALEFAKEIKKAFPDYKGDIKAYDLSLSVATHVGSGTLALGAVRKSEYLGDE